MNLVIVESPAKAKTIEKFLGGDYKVTSSYGHIRDLKKRDFSIDIDHQFQPIYEIPEEKVALVEQLKRAAATADTVWLASDEDREGEAISWHLYEVLQLSPEKTKRIVFHEITEPAILAAIKNPRTIDMDLVNAQQARRILDRIVGFQLSPILWKKVKPSLSAGRVQSVAVRLIVEREREIVAFKPEATFRVTASFDAPTKGGRSVCLFKAELSKRFGTKEEAEAFLRKMSGARFTVSEVQKKPMVRQPAPPFTTSTLQQEAARKLHFPVGQTMSVAQRLYEAGKITYMRTDSVNLSEICLKAAASTIAHTMGEQYVKTRRYATHTKGAQEAHEAIRPTDMEQPTIEGTTPEKRLYELIWKRTIASQMADAKIEKTTAEIAMSESDLTFTAAGEVVEFDGFLKVYTESRDDVENDDHDTSRLPWLEQGTLLTLHAADAEERYTMYPPRYSEAALVKKMEELGIGRPSTYAPTISTIQAREYVVKSDHPAEHRDVQHLHLAVDTGTVSTETVSESYQNDKGKLIPTDVGTVVNDFLLNHFPDIMNYNFTATVEEEFDRVAEGKETWLDCIGAFYAIFQPLVTATLNERSERKTGERYLGKDPKTGRDVSVKISRFGPVVQLGSSDDKANHPQFTSLLKGMSIATITLDEALHLFDLPRTVGIFEDTDVVIGVGKFGPYVKHAGKYISLPALYKPETVTLEEAVSVIEAKRNEDQNRVMRTFTEDSALTLLKGRFGPYLTREGKNYKIPKGTDPMTLTYEQCQALMAAADAAEASGERKVRHTSTVAAKATADTVTKAPKKTAAKKTTATTTTSTRSRRKTAE